MFEPEVFGLKASDWLAVAGTLATVTTGFLFLYLSKQPLSELPFGIKTQKPVPQVLLPVFALGMLTVSLFAIGCYAILHLFVAEPDITVIRDGFQITRSMPSVAGGVRKLMISVDAYDGNSNLRIFVNGYRAFGTAADCRAVHQCKDLSDSSARMFEEQLHKLNLVDQTVHRINRQNSLPLTINLSPFLTFTGNYIDIHSENSGAGGCRARITLLVTDARGKSSTYGLVIDPNDGMDPVRDGELISEKPETFYAGGTGYTPERIAHYGTWRPFHLRRVCHRIRIDIPNLESELPQTDQEWRLIMKESQRREICEVIHDTQPYCGMYYSGR